MKKQAAIYLAVLSCGMLAAGGCAKTALVKKDESLVPSSSSSVTTPAQAKTEIAKAAPVREETVKQEAGSSSAGAEQLKEALNRIYFNFDSFKLSDTARTTLVKNADLVKKDLGEKIRIEGNCDERGSDEYNLALGEKRAKEAMQYMVNLGIQADRLSIISYGKEKPVDPGHDETAWAKNRRDDFVAMSKSN